MPTCPDSECHRMRTRFERRQWDHNRSLPIPFSLDKVDRFWEGVWGTPKTYQVQLAPDALSKFAQWMTTATTGNTYMLELEYLVGAKCNDDCNETAYAIYNRDKGISEFRNLVCVT